MIKMKDSGIEWIGQIPEHWEVKRIRHIVQERNEKNENLQTTTMLSLSAKNGVTLYDEEENHSGNRPREDLSGYKVVHPGDIVVNSMNILSGAVGLSKYNGCVSPVYYMYEARKKYSRAFVYDIFQSKQFQLSLRGLGKGILIKESENGTLNTIRTRIPSKKLLNEYFPVPPKEEQQRIADYLDKKCSQIERLIKLQENEIEKLKEYKKKTISETISQGINKNVKTRESGIDWIGQIPEHWDLIRFKFCHQGSNVGESIDKEFLTDDEKCYVFYTAGLSTVYTKYDNFPQSKFTTENDLLLSRNGNPYVYIPKIGAIYSDHVIRVKIKSQFNKQFIVYALQSSISYEIAEGVSIVTWSIPIWDRQILPIPSRKEQAEIVEFLNMKCKTIDKLINLKIKKIDKLNFYRQSLIYECVTGKKEI